MIEGTPALFVAHTGVVVDFDERRGLGVVRESSGEERPFHCTAVSDGTRAIAPGTAVVFFLRAGLLGGLEAVAITSPEIIEAALGH